MAADAVQLDTSKAGEHKIDYVATDAAGLTSTTPRALVGAPATNDNAPAPSAGGVWGPRH